VATDLPYDDSESTPKDRVRGLVGDTDGPSFRYSDGRIVARLSFAGEPNGLDVQPPQEIPETRAAIALLETSVIVTGGSTTLKLGDDTYTVKQGTTGGYEGILLNLRNRLNALLSSASGDFGPVVFDGKPCVPAYDPSSLPGPGPYGLPTPGFLQALYEEEFA
jgi:hypothetical protein